MTSWSQKRPGAGKFTPENVDPLLCTHVIYAFATLKNHKLAAADEKDIEMYDRVVALREKNPSLKVSWGACIRDGTIAYFHIRPIICNDITLVKVKLFLALIICHDAVNLSRYFVFTMQTTVLQ
jgi:hypothetical protein